MLIEVLRKTLSGSTLSDMSQKLGADEDSVGSAISSALPILLGALARNTQNAQGASSLMGALDRDHDGSILDDVAGFLLGGAEASGDGILSHLLGNQLGAVESAMSGSSGLDNQTAGKLLGMIAPVVMGALGQAKRSKQLNRDGLASLLEDEANTVKNQIPPGLNLSSLLYRDGDGQISDDLSKLGGGLLGKLMGD